MPGFSPAVPAIVLDGNSQPAILGEISFASEEGETHQLVVVLGTNRAALSSCWNAGWCQERALGRPQSGLLG